MACKALTWKPTDRGNIEGGGEEAAFTLVLISSQDKFNFTQSCIFQSFYFSSNIYIILFMCVYIVFVVRIL